MPNQRAKNKVYLGGYIEKELYEKVLHWARQSGMQDNKFGFVRNVLKDAVQKLENGGGNQAS